jgi:hypothetical protein
MLSQRIIGAFTFRKGVYAEVEQDTNFTQTAVLIVIISAFLSQLGGFASGNLGSWLIGAVGATVADIAIFFVAAFVISWLGEKAFYAEVTFDEMIRTIGLAYVWNAVGVIGILAIISPSLTCITGPIILIANILLFVAMLIAAKEALDKEWLATLGIVFISWMLIIVLRVVVMTILSFFGVTVAAFTSLLGF